ncbi:MAG: periplasmic heavy metal sensor [Proteobacteria bacterium]|nr:periplasmic heavy metal sensor [Pseudomonadota bacterium]
MNKTKLILLALLVSVAVNLFFIGGIGYRASRLQAFSGRPFPPNVGWIVRDLSEERRSELASFLERSADEIGPMRGQMFAAQRQVNQLMAAPEFDSEAINQAFAELREVNLRYQALSHEQSIALLNELTAQERQMALEFVNRRGPRDGRDGFRGRERGFGGPRGPGGPRRFGGPAGFGAGGSPLDPPLDPPPDSPPDPGTQDTDQ